MANFEIVAREDFSDVTYLLEIRHPLMAKAARAGQFVIVMSHEHGERIPLTIADFDRKKGTITLVIQAVGKTTKEMQQDCVVGTSLYGVTGPMGIPSHIDKVKKVASQVVMDQTGIGAQLSFAGRYIDLLPSSRPLPEHQVNR